MSHLASCCDWRLGSPFISETPSWAPALSNLPRHLGDAHTTCCFASPSLYSLHLLEQPLYSSDTLIRSFAPAWFHQPRPVGHGACLQGCSLAVCTVTHLCPCLPYIKLLSLGDLPHSLSSRLAPSGHGIEHRWWFGSHACSLICATDSTGPR